MVSNSLALCSQVLPVPLAIQLYFFRGGGDVEGELSAPYKALFVSSSSLTMRSPSSPSSFTSSYTFIFLVSLGTAGTVSTAGIAGMLSLALGTAGMPTGSSTLPGACASLPFAVCLSCLGMAFLVTLCVVFVFTAAGPLKALCGGPRGGLPAGGFGKFASCTALAIAATLLGSPTCHRLAYPFWFKLLVTQSSLAPILFLLS